MWERGTLPFWSWARAQEIIPEVTTKPAHASGRSSHRQESRTPPVRDELGSQPERMEGGGHSLEPPASLLQGLLGPSSHC